MDKTDKKESTWGGDDVGVRLSLIYHSLGQSLRPRQNLEVLVSPNFPVTSGIIDWKEGYPSLEGSSKYI